MASLRTAIELKEAIDSAAQHLSPIGICLSKVTDWKAEHGNWNDEDEDDDDVEDEEDEDEVTGIKKKKETGTKVMENIYDLHEKSDLTMDAGTIKEFSSTLKITRAGYEYEGDIVAQDGDHVAGRLREWYQAGTISGYGDVKAQETKIDPEVRNAREIPASEVSISPDLLSKVEELWSASFFPTKVRAEVYKIHLYGPGGMFRAHRDTPETDLVGTFLLGLGDTCTVAGDSSWNPQGALKVKSSPTEWKRFTAEPGSWVAFYPDVEHSVLEIESGYRAVIAFKIFRQLSDVPEVPADVVLRNKLKAELLNGFDAVLYAAAGETGDAKLLPVLVRFNAEHWEDDFSNFCNAKVYPLTEMHISALTKHLKDKVDQNDDIAEEEDEEDEEEKKPKSLFVDLKGTDAEWIHNHSETIPFYSPNFDATTVVWSQKTESAVEYTGNEAIPDREDSIYLSYAVVVVPKRGTKRAGAEVEE
ncbi:hypothetical protein FB45DRAFT_1056773 [Roridomyces roridus]|uniref:Fe2OG dioxygenase domain-containing protein n=1 Tax=Roridomyces roridus TaxID=1738132 RepID=A0AAD7FNQ3_9AGAR|nr:hypothetical protein FB45DRAFT_1056773 [Roridomyces roridus]